VTIRPVDSPEFRRWFGASKVVDERGQPLVVYHGTRRTGFDTFRPRGGGRALFFTDYAPAKGKFSLQYLARVIAEGDTTAPPARIEAMYQPDKYGLSSTQRIRTLPSGNTKVAGK
jgi:hypothetical protein